MEKYDEGSYESSIWALVDKNENSNWAIDMSIDELVEQKQESKNFSLNMDKKIQQLQSELDFLKEHVQFLESHRGLGTFEEGDPFK